MIMENNVNLNEMKFRRDDTTVNLAVRYIIDFLKKTETQKKTSREIMSDVLTQINEACSLSISKEETPDHNKVLHSNDYFKKLISNFNSNETLLVDISGTTLKDVVNNLRLIKEKALNEKYAKDITEILDIYLGKLTSDNQ